jgi:putative oxidoreductase
MAAHGMTAIPLLLTGAILVEILVGAALLLGFQTRVSAGLLFVYLIPTTLVFHNFWMLSGAEQQMQMVHFLKNLAIMGGLLEFVGVGAGALSLDAFLSRTGFAPFPEWLRPRHGV